MGRFQPKLAGIMKISAIAILLINGIASGQTGHPRAVIVGVRRYPVYAPTKPLSFANQDASLFEQYLKSGKAGKFQNGDLIVIRDEGATLDRVHLALREAILGAQPGDRVYIFISARGIARQNSRWAPWHFGSGRNQTGEHWHSVSELRDIMLNSKAQRIFFSADVCRDPPTNTEE